MASLVINSIVTQRTDMKQNWEILNPVLLKGEIGVELDTMMMKIGDGVTNWMELSPINVQSIENNEIDEILSNY